MLMSRCVDTSPGILWPGTEMSGQFCPGGHLSGYPFVRVDRCPGGQMSGQFCPPGHNARGSKGKASHHDIVI